MTSLKKNSTYIGDGVYASFDGYQIWLQTFDGYNVTNEIALDPNVLDALERFKKTIFTEEDR